jgi:hypothetical protein
MSSGYLQVHIKDINGNRKTVGIHKLICLTYHGVKQNQSVTASHKNGNKLNNKSNNLIWESYSKNFKRKIKHGTDDIGIHNSRAKINLKLLKKIKTILSKQILTHQQIADKFHLSRVFITKINTGTRYMNQGNF